MKVLIFLHNFWNGKITLWKSYWLIGELLNSIVYLIIFNIEFSLFRNIELFQQLPYIDFKNFSLINKFFLFFWTIFITVGIWKSAETYKGKFIWILLTLIFLSYRIFTLRTMLY